MVDWQFCDWQGTALGDCCVPGSCAFGVLYGKKLYKAANEPKFSLWVGGTGHNDDIAAIAGDSYWQMMNKLTKAGSEKAR